MRVLITAAEVVKIAFANSPGMDPSAINEATILAAQQKFIKPVVGKVYQKLENGDANSLLEDYVKPALAYCTKILAIPTLASIPGNMGILAHKSDNFAFASEKSILALKKQARTDANAFLQELTDHLEKNPEKYPEYDTDQNVLNRISTNLGVVI